MLYISPEGVAFRDQDFLRFFYILFSDKEIHIPRHSESRLRIEGSRGKPLDDDVRNSVLCHPSVQFIMPGYIPDTGSKL